MTIVLGVVGYLDQANLLGIQRSALDALYRTIQLFVLEWNADPSPIPTSLQIARFLAPTVAGLAAAKAFALLFRFELERLWVRLFGRGHVVVCGQGQKGWRLARSLRDAGWRVAGVEIAEPERPISAWALIPGDATEPETLRRAAAQRARHLVALCGDDATNAAIVEAARTLGGHALQIHMLADEPRLAALLRAESVMTHDRPSTLEFFTLEGRGAGLLLDSFDPPPTQMIVIGESPFGQRVAVEAGRRWPNAAVDLVPGSISIPDISLRTPVDGRSAVVVAMNDETRGLTVALTLAQALKETPLGMSGGSVEVVVLSSHASRLTDLAAGGHGPNAAIRIRAFDLLGTTLTEDLITGGARESIARAIHESYRLGTSSDQPSPHLVAWDQLDDDARVSSRAAAGAVGHLLRAIGCDLVVADDRDEVPLILLPSEVELMAMLEHDRWLEWSVERTPFEASANRVDWFDLPEESRVRVKEVVGRLPATLLRAGQRVVRLDRSYARALHTAYVERHLSRGESVAENPSLVPWDRLPASLQDSNRDQLAHLRVKLRSLRFDLASGEAAASHTFSAEEIDWLAKLEHERWVRHRVSDGWTLGSPKDSATKVTPYLVPWSELDEKTRETDREFVRSIPDMARRLGQHIAPTRSN